MGIPPPPLVWGDRGRGERGVRAVLSGLTGVLARVTTDRVDDSRVARCLCLDLMRTILTGTPRPRPSLSRAPRPAPSLSLRQPRAVTQPRAPPRAVTRSAPARRAHLSISQHRARTGGRGGARARSHAPLWPAAGAEPGGADARSRPGPRGSAAVAEAVSVGAGGGAGGAGPPPLVAAAPRSPRRSGTGAGAAGSR